MHETAQKAADLLRELRSFSLTFSCGSAYISRSYVEKQREMRERIEQILSELQKISE